MEGSREKREGTHGRRHQYSDCWEGRGWGGEKGREGTNGNGKNAGKFFLKKKSKTISKKEFLIAAYSLPFLMSPLALRFLNFNGVCVIKTSYFSKEHRIMSFSPRTVSVLAIFPFHHLRNA